MNKESLPEVPEMTVGDAVMEINAIKQRILQSGSVDTEPSLLNEIVQNLIAGEMEIDEALRRARGIEESRQDYH